MTSGQEWTGLYQVFNVLDSWMNQAMGKPWEARLRSRRFSLSGGLSLSNSLLELDSYLEHSDTAVSVLFVYDYCTTISYDSRGGGMEKPTTDRNWHINSVDMMIDSTHARFESTWMRQNLMRAVEWFEFPGIEMLVESCAIWYTKHHSSHHLYGFLSKKWSLKQNQRSEKPSFKNCSGCRHSIDYSDSTPWSGDLK
jgi:hypothetical protein